jgi:uncharacterized membrane protein YfcA
MQEQNQDLDKIKHEIEELVDVEASTHTSLKFIDRINSLNAKNPLLHWFVIATVVLMGVIYFFTFHFVNETQFSKETLLFLKDIFNEKLFIFIAVGIGAQLVDGALGMAYGATCTSFLLSLGVTPAVASASVHIAEVFTTGASGLSHLKFGNVNKKLFLYLLIPGMIGAVLGAYIISDLIDGKIIKPFMALYMLILGAIILKKAFKKNVTKKEKTKNLGFLAFFGGFMDAIGGGGWGPIVTSTLVSKGRSANYTIGSVNLAEFFIALAGAGTFVIFLKISGFQTIVGLIIGGIIAAPFAAYVVSRIKRKYLMVSVGILVILLSFRTFVMTDFSYFINLIK